MVNIKILREGNWSGTEQLLDDEPKTAAMMDAYLEENGYENDLTDAR